MSRRMAPRPDRPDRPTEQTEQIILAQWLDHRPLLWCHVPNEGKRRPGAAMIAKRCGLKSGVPDVLIFTPPPARQLAVGTAIELKRERYSPSDVAHQQAGWLAGLEECGWVAMVCGGASAAISELVTLGY